MRGGTRVLRRRRRVLLGEVGGEALVEELHRHVDGGAQRLREPLGRARLLAAIAAERERVTDDDLVHPLLARQTRDLCEARPTGGALDDADRSGDDACRVGHCHTRPGGPEVEKQAGHGEAKRFPLPRPMQHRKDADFSLSGLKTALRLEAEKIAPLSDQDVADLCASFQQAVVDVVYDRLRSGLRVFRAKYGSPSALVAAGGVAANLSIRKALHRVAFDAGTVLVAPPLELCTDNGAMIAWAGAERLKLGLTDSLEVAPRARWPLDEIAAAQGRLQGTAAYK